MTFEKVSQPFMPGCHVAGCSCVSNPVLVSITGGLVGEKTCISSIFNLLLEVWFRDFFDNLGCIGMLAIGIKIATPALV
jgi:hypothetical protein